MKLLELEVGCPECGGTVVWTEQQIIGSCNYCSSLLCFEPDLEHRFYLEARVRSHPELKEVLAISKAEQKRAEAISRYPADEESDPLRILSMIHADLAPFLTESRARIELSSASLIYVPYWNFQATLFQCLLAVDKHGTKEYRYRRVQVDQPMPAYDQEQWNFRDRGLRFKNARLKEVTRDLLLGSPHLMFLLDSAAMFDAIFRAHPPVEPASHFLFRHHTLCDQRKIPVLRPYWIVEFQYEGMETLLVDACFGTVAGHPDCDESAKLFAYREKPHVVPDSPLLKVISSRCPVCGVDTPWGRTEKIHFCGNCGRALSLRSGKVHVQPYRYVAPAGKNSIMIPFWNFRIHIKYNGKEYTNLGDYFRLFFHERLMKGRSYSDTLSIPAIRIKQMKKGDQMLAELIVSAAINQSEFVEGPMQPPPGIRFGEIDVESASEMLGCSLPSASGVVPALYKSGNLVEMLKKSTLRFDQSRLTLLPFKKQGQYLVINKKTFSMALMDEE